MRRALEWLGGSVLVYVLLAACAGANGGGHQAAAGGAPDSDEVAAGGVPATPPAGGKDGAMGGALGGMLDPVPAAMAAGNGGAGSAQPAEATYTKKEVKCSGELKSNGSNFPAAIVDLDPPSLLTAARVLAITKSSIGDADGPWVQASSGALASPDGAKIGFVCAKATDTVTVFLPD